MKKNIIAGICFVCLLAVLLSAGAGTVNAAGIRPGGNNHGLSFGGGGVMDYKAEFIPNGFVYFGGCPFTAEHVPAPVVFISREQLDGYINKIIAEFTAREKGTEFPDGYVRQFKQSVWEHYSRFDADFFAANNLIVGVADRGSGSLRFEFAGVKTDGNTMAIMINRHTPMIQTMDFISWTLLLSVPKSESGGGASGARIEIVNL